MVPGFDVLAVSGLLWLVGTKDKERSAASVQCRVPKAPQVSVAAETDDIVYDFTQTAAQLAAMGSNSLSPYAPSADTTTGGLRHDRPKMELKVSWGTETWPQQGVTCLWYDKVAVKVRLSPKIYVAREYASGACKEAIVEHELKHVKVDREVMNKYAATIGKAAQDAVNAAGALGPYKTADIDGIQKELFNHVKAAIDVHQLPMESEMRKRQGAIDSLKEYERISKICGDILKKQKKNARQ